MAQTCAMWRGVEVSREDLIKYVANKLGGVHYDPSRGGRLRLKFIALDMVRKKSKLMHLDGVYFEFLATARHLVDSPSIANLLRSLRRT